MPVDACQFFYDCKRCGSVLRPLAGDAASFAPTPKRNEAAGPPQTGRNERLVMGFEREDDADAFRQEFVPALASCAGAE